MAQAAAVFCFHSVKPILGNGVGSPVVGFHRKFLVLGISLLALIVEAATDDFSTIPKRNAFGLLPPKPEQKPSEVKPDLPRVSLQGVTTLFDSRQALLKIQSKAKLTAPEVYCILGERQELDGVQVLRIDMKSGTVWLINQGVEQVLTLKQ